MSGGDPLGVLSGGGEMGALMRVIDWSKTGVGPVERWPQSLRTALSILLETGFPMYIAWGRGFTQFYNDGYRPILGSTKHPAAMGASTRDTFGEIWDIIGPMFEGVMEGTPTTVVDFLLPLDRHGFVEECYFIFSYSPIRQENGDVGGVLVTVTETTQRVLGERRLKTTHALAERTREARTVREACASAAATLSENQADLPFAAMYLVSSDRQRAVLETSCSVPALSVPLPEQLPLGDTASFWAVERVLRTQRSEIVEFSSPGDHQATRALVLPIVEQGRSEAVGVLVAALSPRLLLDDRYIDFVTLIASQIGTAIASARAFEEAQLRAAALAELDRAKTAFFSNVSHEFRTPLTLLLGPTGEALRSGTGLAGDELQSVYRNAQRLQKLVNTLLDFSRIEAGRVQAVFEPVDLALLTTDLASAFRSAAERAGLELVVACDPLPEHVHVDVDMWEKVLLNLVSNAFKFTFAGEIRIALVWRGSHVELRVSDTGVGIPEADVPRVFDRFHRVEQARARTHEGSGIGLALVRELVLMHGGTIEVTSVPDRGSTFTVRIPTGTSHLPAERVQARRTAVSTATGATAYVEEALRWLPSPLPPAEARSAEAVPSDPAPLGTVLVADDNADMREYVVRLLRPFWRVETVSDGLQALNRIRADRPDLLISDVMMPRLDGFALLTAIRNDDALHTLPVILLSARAGEEARVEGLGAGADDYLVKPFSARELVARVQAQIVKARVRSAQEAQAHRLVSIFQHAPVGIAILRGPEHVFEYANAAYEAMVANRGILGKPVREALPELDGQGIYELLDGVYASGEPHVGRSLRILMDRGGPAPEETFFDFVYQPLTEDGRVTGIAVVCFDVTEIARARRQAEQANRAKDEFLAMLGHELRNPLAPILTALQLMRLKGVEGADRERAIIERQVQHVVGLVNDLLDISRITRGKVQLKRERLRVADVVAKAIEMTSPAMEARRHTLLVDCPRHLAVEGDSGRLAQVFANLLTNAAKYTDAGGEIQVLGRAAGDVVTVEVRDNGSGIAPEMLPRIFDLFTQERQDAERSQGGLGIGLAIVRSLVEAHGGEVAAASAGPGAGSTFTVRLAAASFEQAEAHSTAQAGAPRPGGVRLLLVDDNVDAAELLADSLRVLGHTVATAHDGPAALAVAGDFRPQAALLDLGLPVMDGYELAERLAERPGSAPALIAVSGYAQDVDRRRSNAAGFVAHLAKPVDVHALDTLVRSVVTSG